MSWDTQPPYAPPDQRPSFYPLIRGSCHCKRITYSLSRDAPLSSKLCHCKTCQTIHGAPCQWAAIFNKADMAFDNGPRGLHFYHAPLAQARHTLPCKVSCEHCGALIMDEGRGMVLLFPSLLELDGQARERFRVQCHIFYPERVIDVPDGTPKWEGLDGKSRLLDLP